MLLRRKRLHRHIPVVADLPRPTDTPSCCHVGRTRAALLHQLMFRGTQDSEGQVRLLRCSAGIQPYPPHTKQTAVQGRALLWPPSGLYTQSGEGEAGGEAGELTLCLPDLIHPVRGCLTVGQWTQTPVPPCEQHSPPPKIAESKRDLITRSMQFRPAESANLYPNLNQWYFPVYH